MRSRSPGPLHVTIVSKNVQTIDGLEEFLRRAGVSARGIRSIEAEATPAAAAYVIFPDDFRFEEVVEGLRRLRREQPRAIAVLVTSAPQRFAQLPDDGDGAAVVLPKPAWGWTILDSIRSRFPADGPGARR
jgi:hypothetical protein